MGMDDATEQFASQLPADLSDGRRFICTVLVSQDELAELLTDDVTPTRHDNCQVYLELELLAVRQRKGGLLAVFRCTTYDAEFIED